MKSQNRLSNLQNLIKKSEDGNISFLPSEDFSIFNNSENLHFVGFGGAGSNIIEYLQSKGIKAKFTCISNPIRPHISSEIQFINYIYEAVNEIPKSILNIFESNEKFILLTGFGGNIGTFFTVEISKLLHKKKIPFLTIASMPFNIETEERHSKSDLAFKELEQVPSFYYYKFSEIKSLLNLKMSFEQMFEKISDLIYELYKANKNPKII